MVEVRSIRQVEWELLKAIRLEALRDAPEAFCTRYDDVVCSPDRYWMDFASQNGNGDAITLLALDGDSPVGMTVGVVHSETVDLFVEVLAVFVSLDLRRRGVADMLFDAVESWSVTKGAASTSLLVEEENTPARRFYEGRGYEEVNERVSSPSGGGFWQMRYRKELARG